MEQEARFQAYRSKHMRRTLATWVTFGVLLLLVMLGVQDMALAVRAAVAFAVGGAYFGFIWYDWRCPECRERLGRPARAMTCPHCGAPLAAEAAQGAGGRSGT